MVRRTCENEKPRPPHSRPSFLPSPLSLLLSKPAQVLALVLPPVAQHWVVIVKYRSHLLYTVMVLIIEIWFQSEFYSAYDQGNFSMKFAGTALLVSHYLYFLSATLSLRHGMLPFLRLDQKPEEVDLVSEAGSEAGKDPENGGLESSLHRRKTTGGLRHGGGGGNSLVTAEVKAENPMSMSFVVMGNLGPAKQWKTTI